MLSVARRIAPPCVVCDDGHGLCALAYVIAVVFSVNRFIAYGAADWNALSVKASDLEQRDLLLAYASAHDASEKVVYLAEYRRVRRLFHCNHQLAFMEDLSPLRAVCHEGGIVRFNPQTVLEIPCVMGWGLLGEYVVV